MKTFKNARTFWNSYVEQCNFYTEPLTGIQKIELQLNYVMNIIMI